MKSTRTLLASSSLKVGVSALALLSIVGAGAAYAQDDGAIETVTVTGFRASLEKALDMKRNTLNASDSIMAEDIAKFPDMNVSESLQRIPGVAITRESGEGREVTVRGLGAQFTRVKINGMEALTTTGGQDTNTSGGGTNRGRGFDFNVFASELFSALTIHKSASAELEEGSLGATVDLHTGHPFDHSGFLFTTSGQWGFGTYAGQSNPRVAMLASNTFLGGRFGVLVSGAYSVTNTLEEGSDNGRWVSDKNTGTTASSDYQFASVNGLTSGTDFTTANAAFRPRFPRYVALTLQSKRLGLTGSVQWQPDDNTLFTVDAMFADFKQIRHERYMESYALSQAKTSGSTKYPTVNSGTYCKYYDDSPCSTVTTAAAGAISAVQLYTHSIGLINYSADDIDTSNNDLARADLTNVGLRTEHRLDHLDTRFMQVTADGTHSFSEQFKIHALLGWSESHHRNPIQTTITADYGCVNGGTTSTCTSGAGTTSNPYQYDYSYGTIPLIKMGLTDATNAAETNGAGGWYLSQIRERAMYNFNSFRTAVLDTEYDVTSVFKVQAGLDYRNYGYHTIDLRRSMGGNTNLDTVIPYAIQKAFLANPKAYAEVTRLKAIDTPKGSTTAWWTPNIEAFNSAFGIWDQSATHYPFTDSYAAGTCDTTGASSESNSASGCGAFHMGIQPNIGANGQVTENSYGGWTQASWDTALLNIPVRGNIGVRYILTESSSTGYSWDAGAQSVVTKKQSSTYHDVLPSFNMVIEPAENLLVRFNANYAMSRPGLTSMLPTASAAVSGGNWTYSIGNPDLKPTRSKNLDLAFEWYFSKGSMLSLAGFYKHIDSIVQSYSYSNTFAGMLAATTLINGKTPAEFFYLSASDITMFIGACGGSGTTLAATTNCSAGANTQWKFSKTVNSKGAPLYGAELNWQQQLNFLPHPFDNFGLLANATYVQAQQTYYSGTINYKADLTGLSRTSYNGTIYYDDTVFQARLTGAFRSHFMIDSGVNTLNYGVFSKSSLNIDFSASYKFDDNLMFTVDALNLTNQGTDLYIDKDNRRTLENHTTGSTIFAGVKYTY